LDEEGNSGRVVDAPGAVIIHFPQFSKLKSSVAKLRTELSMLVLEHDELLYVECKNIEMAYVLAIGGLLYRAHEADCAMLRAKRKVELVQAKKNRQEKVVLAHIEEILDLEFAEYQAQLNHQIDKMNAAILRQQSKLLSEAEARELKSLYRSIVKALHPDINPDLSTAKIQLFYNAVRAYESGDINGLRLICEMVAESILPEDTPEAITQLTKEEERLTKLLQTVRDRIAMIKSEYPYNVKSLLQSAEELDALRDELEVRIKQSRDALAAYTSRIEKMLR